MTIQTPSPERTNNLANQAAPSANDAGTLAERGADAVRARVRQARDNAQRASRSASKYIKNGPIKSLVIAAAVGAALMAVVSLVVRQRDGSIERPPRNPSE
ncbi:MAG: hypothetical protein JWO52_1648 [Gammaproteobacteria bacterium]|nr:hypothetical protein [Gammaproteobacteria bacterium]